MIVGQKVLLRALEETDLERTHGWVNAPEIVEAIGVQAPTSRKQQQQWFENLCRDRSKVVFAICVKDTGQHVGNVSLRDIDPINRTAMFSIFIGENSCRGQGIGEEAARLVLQYAFGFLNLHKVWLKTTADNAPAAAMYRKLGFKEEGCLRQHEFRGGKYVDKLLFGMLAEESAPVSGKQPPREVK